MSNEIGSLVFVLKSPQEPRSEATKRGTIGLDFCESVRGLFRKTSIVENLASTSIEYSQMFNCGPRGGTEGRNPAQGSRGFGAP